MEFGIKDKAKILLENDYQVWLTVTTKQSKFKGKIFELISDSSINIWRAYVRREHGLRHNTYYYWSSVKLSDKSEKQFASLRKNNKSQIDFLGKEILSNNLLFFESNLYKVEFCTAYFLYLRHYTIQNSRPNLDRINQYVLEYRNPIDTANRYYVVKKNNSYRLLLIDNPLDILRIANEN